MQQYNKYVKQWQDLCIQMNEAMQKDDFKLSDELLKQTNEIYEHYKQVCSYPSDNRKLSFGELNYMLENEIPQLFQKNKKALKECTSIIKHDPNLLSQFKFMDSLRNYNCDGDARSFVTESLALAAQNVDRKTMQESLKKFADVLSKYEVGGYQIDEETKKFYKDCERIISQQKRITNLTEHTNTINSIANYIEEHKVPVVESKDNVKVMAEALEKKMANLSEEDKSLVQDIIDFKQPVVEARQERVLNKFKNECLNTIKTLKENTTDANDINGLDMIQEQIEGMVYCKETIVQNIAKLLEIRDILAEK